MTFKIGQQRFSKEMVAYGGRDIVLPFDIMAGQLPLLERWKMNEDDGDLLNWFVGEPKVERAIAYETRAPIGSQVAD